MIVYGVCVGTETKYETMARPGLERLGARVIERRGQTSIFPAYNSIIDEALDLEPEALVLLHEDVEIRDPDFEAKVQDELRDPSVAILGVIGGRGLKSMRWSQAKVKVGRSTYPGGELRFGFEDPWADSVDGLLLVLSPWAMKNLRFDEDTYHGFHGYDADICMQAREKGMRVRVFETDACHTSGGYGNVAAHRAADDAFRAKWGFPRDSLRHRWKRRRRGKPY